MTQEPYKHGDIVLFGGANGIMSRLIRYFDRAQWTHIGIVWKLNGETFILDMWTKGLELVPISKRLKIYSETQILRPTVEAELIDYILCRIIKNWSMCGEMPYDYGLLPRIAIARRLGIDFLNWGKTNAWICSEFVQRLYVNNFTKAFRDIDPITPHDFWRIAEGEPINEIKIIKKGETE
jgi:hypothetical protein